ncbi:uncharacterized protein LOC123891783 [Trifolium pratense]|uniref:uncharacterized protein LOC123891783 n=1 Tax=Trifolium pratense TaxID=57577 RepID=UPI001E6957D8|nr:uncharacterized protein LOC123891783 [Trifolium pratense]
MSKKKEMEDLENNNGDFVSNEEIRIFIESLTKPQLVDLLSQLGSKYPSIAQEIESFANVDRARRNLNAFQVHGKSTQSAPRKSTQSASSAPNKFVRGVCMLDDETRRIRSAPDLSERNLFIENLSAQVTREMLLDYFERHGDIEECLLVCQRRAGSKVSSYSGIVTYKTAEAAKKAIDDLDQTTLGGRTITVKYYDTLYGGGQPSVPARIAPMEALHMSPEYVEGYTYPRPGAPYAAPRYPYPQTGAPFAASPYPYPRTDPPYAVSPYPYPRTDAPHGAPPYPYPRTAARFALPPYPYPQTDAPSYAASRYP